MEALRWLGIEWDEGPDVGGDYGPYVQSQRSTSTTSTPTGCSRPAGAYKCYCSPERLDEVRKAQQARKEPPRYDRHCRELTPAERRGARGGGRSSRSSASRRR